MPFRYFQAKAKRVFETFRAEPHDVSDADSRSRVRYRRVALTTMSALTARGISVAVSVVTVPLVMNYLGKEQYGFWAILTSFASWLILFDFGIINGLLNTVSEAYGKGDKALAKKYTSTAFFILLAISISFLALLFTVGYFVPWGSLFSVEGIVDSEVVYWCVVAALGPVILGLPLSIVRQVYAGYQRAYISNVFLAFAPVSTLLGLFVALALDASLPLLILTLTAPPIIMTGINYIRLIIVDFPWVAPTLPSVTRDARQRLLAISVPLFLFQIGALMVSQSQLFILSHRSDYDTVAEYSVIFRLYLLVSSLIILSTNAMVPPFREAFEQGDRAWIRKAFKQMLLMRMGFAIAASLIMIMGGNLLLELWLGNDNIVFEPHVWIAASVLLVSSMWSSTFGDFLTILDRIWVQVFLVLLNGGATIGLTYLLSPTYGVAGGLVAVSFFSVVILSWVMPMISRPYFSH